MKHYMIGCTVGYGIGIILILLLLLCGAAQACDNYRIQNVEFARDGNMRIHYECAYVAVRAENAHPDSTLVPHNCRMSNPEDWCVGRVDTLWGGYMEEDSCGMWIYRPVVDTTWILCHDSAATTVSKKTLRQLSNEAASHVCDTMPTPPGAVAVKSISNWYIKSVDTVWFCNNELWHDCMDCGRFRGVDTTWAKKIPLSEMWLTPSQWDRLLRLIERK